MRIRHWLTSLATTNRPRTFGFCRGRQIRNRRVSIPKLALFLVAAATIAFVSDAAADESSFFPGRKYNTGFGPCDIDVADFNGDGIDDVVTGNCYEGSLTVLLGNETGILSEPIATNNVFFGVSVRSELAASDFTDDGIQDIVVSRGGLNRLQLLAGSGDGTFTIAQELTTQAEPTLTLRADFDNNGLTDVLFENGFARQLAVSLNFDGVLSDPLPIATVGGVHHATADDFNQDGLLDLAALSFSPAKIEILLGNGDGTFAPVHQLLPTAFLRHVFSSDFDGDGLTDLISLNEDSEFYKGNGDGTFQDGVGVKSLSSALYNFNKDAVISDFNKDGIADIASANSAQYDTYVFFGNGNATFQPVQAYAAGLVPQAIHYGDINGDGILDLITVNEDASNLTTLLGDSEDIFDANPTTPFKDRSGNEILTTDFNGDNRCDLVTFFENDDVIAVRLGLDNASFEPQVFYDVGDRPESIAVNDLNGDGFVDVASANRNSDDVSILFGVGDGTFLDEARIDVAQNPHSIVVGEFTGDQNVDLATVSYSSVSVLPGIGDGNFGKSIQTNISAASRGRSGDFNNDGLTDIAVSDFDNICVLLANGDGTFVVDDKVQHPLEILRFEVADVDGDSNLDLIASLFLQFDLELVVSFGNGDGSFLQQQSFVEPQLTGIQTYAWSIAISDFNGDNVADIAAAIEYSASAHYSWAGAVAVLPGIGDGAFQPFQLFDTITASRSMASGDFNQDGGNDLLVPVFDGEAQLFLNRRQVLLGDVNRDCDVNLLDVEPFIQLIVSGEYQIEADIDQDGLVTLLDVDPFISLLLD